MPETFAVWRETTPLPTLLSCRDKPWISMRPEVDSIQRVTGQIMVTWHKIVHIFLLSQTQKYSSLLNAGVKKSIYQMWVCDRRKIITIVNTGYLKKVDISSQANNFSNSCRNSLRFSLNEWMNKKRSRFYIVFFLFLLNFQVDSQKEYRTFCLSVQCAGIFNLPTHGQPVVTRHTATQWKRVMSLIIKPYKTSPIINQWCSTPKLFRFIELELVNLKCK